MNMCISTYVLHTSVRVQHNPRSRHDHGYHEPYMVPSYRAWFTQLYLQNSLHISLAYLAIMRASFGRSMREAHFNFASSYTPLNHGSFGASPSRVTGYQTFLRGQTEKEPDTFIRFTYPTLLRESRGTIAPLLGVETDEVVFVPNALTAINTVLRNLTYQNGDVILYFSTIYDSCLKTMQSLEETTNVRGYCIDLVYPVEDDEICEKFLAAVLETRRQGRTTKLAMFDTVLTFPGVRFPWERVTQICKEHDILSCIDGAHGIGHIDLRHLNEVGPDFLITNCYK